MLNFFAPLILAAALIFPAWLLFNQPCDEEDNVAARVALFHSNLGTDPTDEYTPAGADPDALHPHNPPYWLLPGADSVDTPAPPSAPPGQAPTTLTLTLPRPENLILNRRDYPGWRVLVNRIPTALFTRADGLIAVPLPVGTDTVTITSFQPWDRLAGLLISGNAFYIFMVLKRRQLDKRDPV